MLLELGDGEGDDYIKQVSRQNPVETRQNSNQFKMAFKKNMNITGNDKNNITGLKYLYFTQTHTFLKRIILFLHFLNGNLH